MRENPAETVEIADLVVDPIPQEDASFDDGTAFYFVGPIPGFIICAPRRRNAFIQPMNEVYRLLERGGMFPSTLAYPHAMASRGSTHVDLITEETFPMYFDDKKRWASIHGFTGASEIALHDSSGPHILAVLRKIPLPDATPPS